MRQLTSSQPLPISQALTPEEKIDKLVELVCELMPTHYWCDGDNWYSCPKAPEGCADDSRGPECDCGAEMRKADVITRLLDLGIDPNKFL